MAIAKCRDVDCVDTNRPDKHRTTPMKSKKTILLAGTTWTIAYILMLIWSSKNKRALWPIAFGSWAFSWEFLFSIVSYCSYKDHMTKKTKASAFVFVSWFFCDGTLLCNLVRFGNGGKLDELGLFPTTNARERLEACLIYFIVCLVLCKAWSVFSLRWYKYQSFVAMHVLYFAQLRLPIVKEAWINASQKGALDKYGLIYAYFLTSFLSHCLFCIDKWNGDLIQPVWLAKLYMLQLPVGNVLTLYYADTIMNASQFAFNLASILLFMGAIVLGPALEKLQAIVSPPSSIIAVHPVPALVKYANAAARLNPPERSCVFRDSSKLKVT